MWEQRPNTTDADSVCPNSSSVFPRTHLTVHITPHLAPIEKEHNFADVHMQNPPIVCSRNEVMDALDYKLKLKKKTLNTPNAYKS